MAINAPLDFVKYIAKVPKTNGNQYIYFLIDNPKNNTVNGARYKARALG
ncbi:MAG: hypothetical protein ABIA91_00220 [Patescibacteria group bacterium]